MRPPCLEQNLARTQSAVASLRDLLAGPSAVAPVSHRQVDATMVAAITADVAIGDQVSWYLGALGELHATRVARGMRPSGPAGGTYAGEPFTDERGQSTVFVPTPTEIPRLVRVEPQLTALDKTENTDLMDGTLHNAVAARPARRGRPCTDHCQRKAIQPTG